MDAFKGVGEVVGQGSAAVIVRVPGRAVAIVRTWATTGAFAFPVTCRAS